MDHSAAVSDRLRAILPRLGDALASAEVCQRLEKSATELPDGSGGVALECHLSAPRPRIDLIARYLRIDRGGLRVATSGEPVRYLADYLTAWSAPHGRLDGCPFIDIECDVDDRRGRPFVCPTIERAHSRGVRGLEASRATVGHDTLRTALAALEVLSGGSRNEYLLERVVSCFAALPEYGYIHYAAPLFERDLDPQPAVRIIVSVPRRDFASYMASLGWGGDVSLVLHVGSRLRAYSDRIDVDLNIEKSGVGPRVGVYGEFPVLRLAHRPLGEVFDWISATDTCRPGAVDDLRAWVRSCEISPLQDLPRPALEFKAVLLGDGRIEFKAYLEYLENAV